MAGKNRKKRKHLRTPPLSFVDKCMYFMLLILFLAFLIGYIIFVGGIWERNAILSDPSVVAVDFKALFWRVPFLLYVVISGFTFLLYCYEDRKPIFGNRDKKYQSGHWEKVYPVFSKEWREKRKKDKASEIRFRRKMWTVWFIGLGITVLLIPFGLFGRWILDDHGVFHRYNFLNQETVSYSASQAEEMRVSITKHKYRYSIQLSLSMDQGGKVVLNMGDFSGENKEEILQHMLSLKNEISPNKLFYKNLYRLDRLISYMDPTPAERKLLDSIFNIQEGSG